MQLSNHAVAQMQQRAISESTIDYLMEWGRKAYDHRGAVIRYFDKSSRTQLIRHVGEQRGGPVRLDRISFLLSDISAGF